MPENGFHQLDTPALLFDLDVVERNIAEMAAVARDAGVALRPHTKTHKSPEIAGMQLAAGASGLTVAKLGEAEVMVEAGLDDLLIAFPIVGSLKLARLEALLDRAAIRVSLDTVAVAEALGEIGVRRAIDIPVLVEVDTGLHRMGRAHRRAVGIARARDRSHPGHRCRRAAHARRTRVSGDRCAARCTTRPCAKPRICSTRPNDAHATGSSSARSASGRRPPLVSPRASPASPRSGPGTYVFNDVQQLRLGVASLETCAARVLVTVVARPTAERFLVDAGSKAFSSDGGDGPPWPGRGLVLGRPDLILDFLSEEHGVGHIEGGGDLAIGERLQVVPLHVCSCVNLFDTAAGIRGDRGRPRDPDRGTRPHALKRALRMASCAGCADRPCCCCSPRSSWASSAGRASRRCCPTTRTDSACRTPRPGSS